VIDMSSISPVRDRTAGDARRRKRAPRCSTRPVSGRPRIGAINAAPFRSWSAENDAAFEARQTRFLEKMGQSRKESSTIGKIRRRPGFARSATRRSRSVARSRAFSRKPIALAKKTGVDAAKGGGQALLWRIRGQPALLEVHGRNGCSPVNYQAPVFPDQACIRRIGGWRNEAAQLRTVSARTWHPRISRSS